jgi:hypothetical protein
MILFDFAEDVQLFLQDFFQSRNRQNRLKNPIRCQQCLLDCRIFQICSLKNLLLTKSFLPSPVPPSTPRFFSQDHPKIVTMSDQSTHPYFNHWSTQAQRASILIPNQSQIPPIQNLYVGHEQNNPSLYPLSNQSQQSPHVPPITSHNIPQINTHNIPTTIPHNICPTHARSIAPAISHNVTPTNTCNIAPVIYHNVPPTNATNIPPTNASNIPPTNTQPLPAVVSQPQVRPHTRLSKSLGLDICPYTYNGLLSPICSLWLNYHHI